jgi:pyruvate dehydrogenase E2 component (dihydrolipoamide acetyltransferase)
VRKRARALGLDISTINGGGPAGRVRMQDLEAATSTPTLPLREEAGGWFKSPVIPAAPIPRQAHRETASGPAPASAPVVSPFAQSSAAEVREELSQARKTIALNMVQSWTTIPHVTDCEDADVTELDRLRQGHNITLREGETKLSLLPFVIRAVAMALTRHPIFNAVFDDKTGHIIYKRAINLAIGMHTERGLIAPVLREADKLNVAQIAAWLAEWTIRGREAKFAVNDLRGGTYTISNAGAMGGSRYSTPIITPGQAAVLALGRTRWEPRAIEQQVVPRYIMPLSHSFDHRIIDGGQEIAFQRDVIGALENPARLLL